MAGNTLDSRRRLLRSHPGILGGVSVLYDGSEATAPGPLPPLDAFELSPESG